MLRSLAVVAFVALFAGVLYAGHAYLASRLVLETALAEPFRTLALATIALLGASLVLEPIGQRFLAPPTQRWLAWPASLWMGFAFLACLALLASDALLGLLGTPALAAPAEGGSAGGPASLRASLVVLLTLGACGAALRAGVAPPRLVRETFEIPSWPAALDGFRIVQLTDIHIGPLLGRAFASELARRANALDPDLVAITGDLVDGNARLLREEVAPFGELRARHGVFFVTGNHDFLSDAKAWVQVVEELGITVLRNRHLAIGEGADSFDLVGVDDHRGGLIGGGGEDLDAALRDRDPERPAVLLAHDPSTFKRARHEAIDLQISGHTHGGQIWPFCYAVRLVVPWVAGRYRQGRAQLYVSRGTGFWGPPMRLFAPAEITEITIRRADPLSA